MVTAEIGICRQDAKAKGGAAAIGVTGTSDGRTLSQPLLLLRVSVDIITPLALRLNISTNAIR
jgi:hypothetical protein